MAEQFLNSWYYRGQWGTDPRTGKYTQIRRDAVIYTVKDTETGETSLKVVPTPKIEFYVTLKPQPFHKISMPINECRKITCVYSKRDEQIATTLGKLNEYTYARRNGAYTAWKDSIMRHPNLYGAEVEIQDFIKTRYILNNQDANGYQQVAKSYNMCFSDTEVDISQYPEEFPDPKEAPCPICLITNIFRDTKECISYILYDERVAEDQKWVIEHPDDFIKNYLDPVITEKFKLNFKFKIYSKEDDLIIDYFADIHKRKPDFCAWWNMAFDIPTIINRLRKLGYNDDQIADIICHPDVPKEFRYILYIEDPKRRMFNETSTSAPKSDEDNDKTEEDEEDSSSDDDGLSKNAKQRPNPSRLVDWFDCPGYTQYYCQMVMYSCLNKRFLLPSYSLDAIAKKEKVGIDKYNLSENGYSIKDCNVKNFKVFLAYNIRDSVVQLAIETKTHNIEQDVVGSSNTRMSKSLSMSNCVKNEVMLYLMRKNEIIGNTVKYNIHEHFAGALVAKPELIEQYGIPISGCSESFVFSDAVDSDASSLYPSNSIINNISKNAIFGRIIDVYNTKTGQNLNKGFVQVFKGSYGVLYLASELQTIDSSIFHIAKTYLGLPTPSELMKKIESTIIKKQ